MGKVVVTGAGGGIGSVLSTMMVARGMDVLGLDIKPNTERPGPWTYANLADRATVHRLLEGVESVIHLGEIPDVWGPFSPDEVYAQNTRVGSTVFQTAAYLGVKRIVYASTAQVYGCWGEGEVAPLRLPLDEDHPTNPQNAYSLSKVANEGYLRNVVRQHPGIGATALRFPGVMGNWWPFDKWANWIRSNEGDHDGVGTYIEVHDLCEAFLLALEAVKAGEYRVYNVLADDVALPRPVQEAIAARWPGSALPEDYPPTESWARADRIRADLGWRPQHRVTDVWARNSA